MDTTVLSALKRTAVCTFIKISDRLSDTKIIRQFINGYET